MAKKSNAGKNADSKDAEREFLVKELRGLIPKLDSEGLAFLVEQGRIHLYNMQVDELNKAALAADAASARVKAGGKSKSVGTAKPAASGKESYKITGTESGSSYYLHCPNDEIMFSRSEMAQLVKIANGKGTDLEIRERLYNWFERERRDIFAAVPMKNKFDDRLKIIAKLIKKSFSIQP